MTIFTIIRRNLRQRLARNVALIFSVALVAALTTVFSAGRNFFATGEKMSTPLIVVEPLYSYGAWLRVADTDKIKALPNVVSVTRTQTYGVVNPEGNHWFPAFGADETYFTVDNADGVWFPTTPEMVEAYRKDRTAFIVGELTAEKMGYQVGKQYEVKTTKGLKFAATCVGIARGGANKVNMVLHYEYIDAVLGNREGRITDWIVAVSDPKHIESTINAIDAIFKTAVIPVLAGPASDHIASKSSKQKSIINLLGLVCVLIFFVTMFITLNTVLFLVRERRQALAAMRAIGFRSGQVFRLVAAEVMVLCVIGGALGVGIVLLLFRNGIPFAKGNMLVTLHPGALVAGGVVTIVIGIVASVIPSWIALRIDILAALRST